MPAFHDTRFTLMCFPQHVDATGKLTLNIIFLPRNINPLEKINTDYNPTGKAEAFALVKPDFVIKVVNDPDEFPGKVPGPEKSVLPINPLEYPANLAQLYQTLKDAKDENGNPKYFDIAPDRNSDDPGIDPKHRAPEPVERATAVRKYLPVSYRQSFNFTSPRVPNAVTDDSYQCAIRDQKPPVTFVAEKQVSWGKVYAHLLRQPLLARHGGLLYSTSIQLDPNDFKEGGWLYVDLAPGSTYTPEQTASLPGTKDPFIKKYAARIPALKPATARSLFAAILFPVMKEGESPDGLWDELFIEATRFSDGFATLVHANQPVSQNLLQEEPDGIHPQKEMGIRLGWEDEQILIWYLRQLAVDESITTGPDRLDAPLGVMGYHIDVKVKDKEGEAVTTWESLTAISSKAPLKLEDITMGDYTGELPYQVYPTKLYGLADSHYWLPMYFANWNNASLVIPDRTAAKLYANDKDDKKPVTLSDTYGAPDYTTKLRYGQSYQFRVRMSDISGGGPAPAAEPENNLPGQIATAPFKRYIAPNTLQIIDPEPDEVNDPLGKKILKTSTDDINFEGDSLVLRRPLLGYPAVVYTGGYTDPVGDLLAVSEDILTHKTKTTNKTRGFLGLPDPDVLTVEIKVEVETLQLDNLGSDDGQEHYITLYNTSRSFDPDDFYQNLSIGLVFKDYPILDLGNTNQPFGEAVADNAIAATSGDIYLPTARDLRLTIRAVGKEASNYWGNESASRRFGTRYGKTTEIKMRRESEVEKNLLTGTADARVLQGIYLQPDPVLPKLDPIVFKTLQGGTTGMPDIVQRLAKQLNVGSNETTLAAENGERIQFWCSNLVRHTLAPDNSSITFANKKELTGHWLVCTNLYLDRDWSWDGLKTSSFLLSRRRSTDATTILAAPFEFIGDLEMRRIASFQAIQAGEDGKVHREYTRLIFIDVIDMKPADNLFPSEIVVQYTLTPQFKASPAPETDAALETEILELPTTINPVQMPKLIGAGVALSPYNRNARYSFTEPRQRFLWLEFDSLPRDPNDGLFARVLAYAPDQLLSNNHPDQMGIPEESPLPVDPEYIRVIIPETAHEHAGLKAMQLMEKSVDKDRHFYLLPLPPGLHHESAELFGFYTYEFRYGHTDKVWSSAQGRFGRPLRVTGLQHPAPNSYCMVNRDEKVIKVNAPYAQAVFKGKNVTSDPPRTAIWCLLYAQVKQADGQDYRNILLDEQELVLLNNRQRDHDFRQKIAEARQTNNALLAKNLQLQWSQLKTQEKENVAQAYGIWENKAVAQRLRLYGLPVDSPLSVLCVEVFGTITHIHSHLNNFREVANELEEKVAAEYNPLAAYLLHNSLKAAQAASPPLVKPNLPLSDNLGMYRILRTSPLTEVPFVCCTD
jgi:hypothetical protein